MKKNINEGGFTLAEIAIILFIIVLLSGIIFANYRAGGQQFALQRSANKLAQDLRRVQQMAMSAKEFEGSVPPGYGVVIDISWNTQKYRLYADTNGDNGFFTPPDAIVEFIELEKGIIIKETGLVPETRDEVSINFRPPDPAVNIKYSPANPTVSEGIITLALKTDLNKTKTITVNEAGLIEIE